MVSTATWRKIQSLSGLFFGFFLVVHLVAHTSNMVSQEVGNSTLIASQKIYRNAIFESLLLASVLLHMASNAVIYLRRAKMAKTGPPKKTDGDKNTKKAAKPPPAAAASSVPLTLHRYLGYILSVYIFGHVFAVCGAPYLTLGLKESEIYDYTMVYLATVAFGNFFAIYLAVMGILGIWHLIYGIRSALTTLAGRSVQGKPYPLMLTFLAIAGSVLLILGVMGIAG